MSVIVDKISYTYPSGDENQAKALDEVSLHIGQGEKIAILGHTGSGKSTLVQHLNGLLKAQSGHIYYNGEDIYEKEYNRKQLRTKVGLVFQYPEYQLFEATVQEDVKYGPRNMELPPLEVDLRCYEALKMVGIEDDLLDASPFELSGGQKRRVAIAGVIAMRPELLILDEPAAGLDPAGRDAIYKLLEQLHEKYNMTIITVSHSMEDSAGFADRLIVMDRGRVVADGTPREVFAQRDVLEEAGLAVPEAAYVLQELKKKGIAIDTQAVLPDEAVELLYQKWRQK